MKNAVRLTLFKEYFVILNEIFLVVCLTLTLCLRLALVTHEDICRCFQGDTLLTIQAPSGTQLEVPIPELVSI